MEVPVTESALACTLGEVTLLFAKSDDGVEEIEDDAVCVTGEMGDEVSTLVCREPPPVRVCEAGLCVVSTNLAVGLEASELSEVEFAFDVEFSVVRATGEVFAVEERSSSPPLSFMDVGAGGADVAYSDTDDDTEGLEMEGEGITDGVDFATAVVGEATVLETGTDEIG